MDNHLIKYFDRLTQSSENVAELKKLVLQLAIRGKLTEEWRNNSPFEGGKGDVETGSELLEKIKAEKAELVKQKKIKRQKPLPKIEAEEIPFEIPNNWIWARLLSIGVTNTGTTPSKNNPSFYGIEFPFVKPPEILERGINYDTQDKLSNSGIKQGRLIPANSVLMVCIGGSMGKCNYTERDISCNQQINTITPLQKIEVEYVYRVLQSPFFQTEVWNRASGGITPIINKGKWEKILFPLPPLTEQKIIVQKVESLFAKIDQLHTLATQRQTLQQKAAESLLKNSNSNGQLLQKNFGRLINTKKVVQQLRQSILQLAVQGKLTEEWRKNSSFEGGYGDVETGAELLEKIQAEKQKLIQEKKIKRQKPLPKIEAEEIPFEVPDSWVWVRLGEIIVLVSGQDLKAEEYSDIENKGLPYITGASNLQQGKVIENRWTNYPKSIAVKGDLLLTCKGAGIGKMAILNIDKVHIARQIMAIRRVSSSLSFIKLIVKTNIDIYRAKAKSLIPGIGRDTVLHTPTPLPPLSEQKIIVQKVEQLLTWCDALEEKISKSGQYHKQLMQAAIRAYA